MGTRYNDGNNGTQIQVPTVEAGELAKEEVKIGKAGRVRMPNGAIVPCGGELLRSALQNGGTLIYE
jgi:hypothetical protein